MKNVVYFLLAFLIVSCKSKKTENDSQTVSNYNTTEGVSTYQNSNYTNSQSGTGYKYEYRTGNSGNYEYNYDISGSDENGNSVNGNIDIQGKYGSGYIQDENGNEKQVEVEWVDYGVLEGTDEDGNTYEFSTDE
jgi:hypothetical protein